MKSTLIIEDGQDISDLVAGILEAENISSKQAFNGEEAIHILAEDKSFDFIILDIIMPYQDGFDVMNYMANNNIDIPVIAISGGGRTISGEVALKSIESKVSQILPKPFSKEELLDAIHKL